jgi:hypothetical protein
MVRLYGRSLAVADVGSPGWFAFNVTEGASPRLDGSLPWTPAAVRHEETWRVPERGSRKRWERGRSGTAQHTAHQRRSGDSLNV